MRTNGFQKPKKDYVTKLLTQLMIRGVEIDIYDPKSKIYFKFQEALEVQYGANWKILGPFFYIYNLFHLRKFLKMKNNEYDLLLLFNVRYEFVLVEKLLLRTAPRSIAVIYGGEFFLNPVRNLFKSIYRNVDEIIFQTPDIQKQFLNYYSSIDKSKTSVTPFPNTHIHNMRGKSFDKSAAKAQLGIDEHSTVIVCGTNASVNEQHEKIVPQLIKCLPFSKPVTLIFPLTYDGSNVRKQSIIDLCSSFGLTDSDQVKTLFFLDYMTQSTMLDLRISTDIFINLRLTDQSNYAMTESMYAGSDVITGSWLPYNFLRDSGLVYHTIDYFSELPGCLENMLIEAPASDSDNNRKILDNLLGEEATLRKWMAVIFSDQHNP